MEWASLAFCQLKWLIPSNQVGWGSGVRLGWLVNGARLKRITAWHLSVQHSKRRRTPTEQRVQETTLDVEGVYTKHCYLQRTWGWWCGWRKEKKEREWMDGGEKNEEEWWRIFKHWEQTCYPPSPQSFPVFILVRIWIKIWCDCSSVVEELTDALGNMHVCSLTVRRQDWSIQLRILLSCRHVVLTHDSLNALGCIADWLFSCVLLYGPVFFHHHHHWQ